MTDAKDWLDLLEQSADFTTKFTGPNTIVPIKVSDVVRLTAEVRRLRWFEENFDEGHQCKFCKGCGERVGSGEELQ